MWEFRKSVIERKEKQRKICHVKGKEKRKYGNVRIIYLSLIN